MARLLEEPRVGHSEHEEGRGSWHVAPFRAFLLGLLLRQLCGHLIDRRGVAQETFC